MAVTVNFDDKRPFRTIEIYDVRTDTMLPAELDPLHLARPQSRPQLLLRTSHSRAKPAFEIETTGLSSCGSGHLALPLLASPYKRGGKIAERSAVGTSPHPSLLRRGTIREPLLNKEGEGGGQNKKPRGGSPRGASAAWLRREFLSPLASCLVPRNSSRVRGTPTTGSNCSLGCSSRSRQPTGSHRWLETRLFRPRTCGSR